MPLTLLLGVRQTRLIATNRPSPWQHMCVCGVVPSRPKHTPFVSILHMYVYRGVVRGYVCVTHSCTSYERAVIAPLRHYTTYHQHAIDIKFIHTKALHTWHTNICFACVCVLVPVSLSVCLPHRRSCAALSMCCGSAAACSCCCCRCPCMVFDRTNVLII